VIFSQGGGGTTTLPPPYGHVCRTSEKLCQFGLKIKKFLHKRHHKD
jgi:hypothetical protein